MPQPSRRSVPEDKKAIFLSYASQDLEPARRICDALQAAGLEVWFDQSELRGGDAWDAAIRRQVRDCTLFMALISANTNARSEGYFRREWNLAVQRMLDMADDRPFLLPALIDDIPEPAARVPDRFRERQWTRLPGGAVGDRASHAREPVLLLARINKAAEDHGCASGDNALSRTVARVIRSCVWTSSSLMRLRSAEGIAGSARSASAACRMASSASPRTHW